MTAGQHNYTIKELPEEERPREKLLKYGSARLSNSELLALIIRTGSKERTAVELAQDILNYFGGLKSLINLGVEEIEKIKGVGPAKGTRINAVIELSKRLYRVSSEEDIIINNPEDVANLLMPELRYMEQEVFKLILLNTRNKVISTPVISKGGLTSSIVHPREVFKEAIRRSSAAIILAHNHPSGLPEPSNDDLEVTEQLIKAGSIMGVEVLDHIIIGDGVYLSMKERGII